MTGQAASPGHFDQQLRHNQDFPASAIGDRRAASGIVNDINTRMSRVLGKPQSEPGDDRLERDAILLCGDEKRIITGNDILGFLMRGIAKPSIAT